MAWQTDYCIMKEGMPILRGRKSVHGISSSERENGKKVPTFLQGEDSIEYINKAMAFLSAIASRGRAHGETMHSAKEAKKFCMVQGDVNTEDLAAYDSNYDDISSAKAVSMVNLSSCDLDVLSEVPYSDPYPNDMINQDVQEMTYSEPDNEITSDSNIIPYSQYLQESQDAGIQDTNSSAPNDLLVLSLVEQMTDHVANLDKENHTNKMVNESLTDELEI
nr:hypothetical protein [Tanacetum cinerariifolium]